MTAEIIAVGTELLRFGRLDSNGEWLKERLLDIGVPTVAACQVDDDAGRIAAAVAAALERASIVIVSGGLGPTDDDRTRQGVSRALGLPLERDPAMASALAERYAAHGYPFSEAQARQAERPQGARWLQNPLGTAPGFELEAPTGALLFALPGVPGELRAVFRDAVESRLRGQVAGGAIHRRLFHVAGRTESSVDRRLEDLNARDDLEVTVLARATGVEIRLLASGRGAQARLNAVAEQLAERFGDDLWGQGEDRLEEHVGRRLQALGLRLAVAESCTAGLLAGTLTRVPGSSAWFEGGIVAYSNRVKCREGLARPDELEREGAVSEAVARSMAAGVRRRFEVELGIGITGIAGPAGGSDEKPVGTVFVALDDGRGDGLARRLRLVGDRELIRRRSVTAALDLLRRELDRR